MVCARGSGSIDDRVTLVSGTGRVQLCGHVKRSSLNSTGCLFISRSDGRDQDLRNKLRLARVLTSKIHPCKGFFFTK